MVVCRVGYPALLLVSERRRRTWLGQALEANREAEAAAGGWPNLPRASQSHTDDEENAVPGLFSKVAQLANSPQGRRAIDKARQAASDPKNRARIEQAVANVRRKGNQPPR